MKPEVAAILSHPNIVPIYEIGRNRKIPFFTIQEIWFSVMECLIKIMPDSDLLGFLEENKILFSLPLTDEKGSNLALQRLWKILDSESFIVQNSPLELKFVALTTSFQQDNMPTRQHANYTNFFKRNRNQNE